ncbi:MAG TPA: DUF423 domain-containing protein, partial [Chitinophagaceae bacterium]|nr:DUF423 domain-containing protein [Chitinophagaceae bacterium]
RFIKTAGILFNIGIILFSGSLYIVTAGKVAETSAMDKAGMITPLGGLAFIGGWLFLFLAAVRSK